MTQIFGNFVQESPEKEYLILFFSPHSFHYQFWKRSKLSADFIADYFEPFLVHQEEEMRKKVSSIKIKNLQHAVKYISNELLENAMKFQEVASPLTIHFQLSWSCEKMIFYVTNSINTRKVDFFQTFIKQLTNENAEELYMKKLMSNAKDNTSSGLGLLSMIYLYSVQLGWKFETLQTAQNIMKVSTRVCLDTLKIEKESW
ncbi:ATP-binding protein [Candidatus Parabeggiatoa sp. HSG14]|uniref:slr1658 superfamily regulator n=1 Tax=Candidatus Parabeggiatoa sp. HSG14 TaxID=3055593 RepID=UPI0025A90BD1|nr:ATP-binding protein [Thiotrichales bacterium HSG14]